MLLLALLAGGRTATAADSGGTACLPGERGFLSVSLRGAIDARPDWHGAQLQCEGGARPDASGLRLSFVGRVANGAHQLRFVFGIRAERGRLLARTLPANLTVIVEGENRIFATLGDDKCTVETLVQEPLPPASGAVGRDYRVAARGFCTAPAVALNGTERLYIDRFDFAGRAHFEDTANNETLVRR